MELKALAPYLAPDAEIDWSTGDIPTCKIDNWSPGMTANARFFSDPVFGSLYFKYENSSVAFGKRWKAAIGGWDGKIVVDVGCGPGNLYAAVGGSPRTIIGIDISRRALEHAIQLGYSPLLADAQNLPLKNGFADVVTLNATLHHCDDMAKVLSEAARLVRPGGVLITDEDPLARIVDYQGIALLIINARKRFPMYWLPGRRSKYRASKEESSLRLETEIHNCQPGDGVTPELYTKILEPLGFKIELYPHFHDVGDELFRGELGRFGVKDTLIRILSGRNSYTPPQSVACIARRIA